ncbi:MAG: lysostaphin resistance A-like protein [Bacteroidota bacterium]
MTQTGISGSDGQQGSLQRRAALVTMLAQLATILIVDALVRSLVEGIFDRNATEWPYNPAVTRIAGTITSRFLEVLAVYLALALLFRLTRFGSFADLGLRRRGLPWLPVGFVVPVFALVLACLIAYLVGLVPTTSLLYPGPWPTLLAVAAATQAAFIEELGFRGVLMQGIERALGGGRRSQNIAIVVSGLLFASLHLLAPFKLTWAWWIVVLAAGLGFGWAFYAAGRNLWLTIGLHLGFDAGLFLLLGLPGKTHGWLLSPVLRPWPSLSQIGGYIMLIGTLLTLLTLYLLLNRRQRRETASGQLASGRTV